MFLLLIIITLISAQEIPFLIAPNGECRMTMTEELNLGDATNATRSYLVQSQCMLTNLNLTEEDKLRLNLFEDYNPVGIVERVVVLGYLEGSVFNSTRFSYATTNGTFLFSLLVMQTNSTNGTLYKAHSVVNSSSLVVSEQTYNSSVAIPMVKTISEDFTKNIESRFNTSRELPLGNPSETIQKTHIFFATPTAVEWIEANGGGDNVFGIMIAETDLVIQHSQLNLQIVTVGAFLTDYVESGDTEIDLNRIRFNRDYDIHNFQQATGAHGMEEVYEYRSYFGADLVTLLTAQRDGYVAGLGWAPTEATGLLDYSGFHLVGLPLSPPGSFVLQHEIGHNMGAGHHNEQFSQPGPQFFSYSAGWRFLGPENQMY
ncbi:hypothetical protein RCL1_009137 [Eukaryota sp. TZLM3-RCL]